MSERRTLTVAEAARELGVSKNVCYAACRAGTVPALRLGRRWVIPRARLEELIGGDVERNGDGQRGA